MRHVPIAPLASAMLAAGVLACTDAPPTATPRATVTTAETPSGGGGLARTIYGLDDQNTLVVFDAEAPGQVQRRVAISGVTGSLVGIDIRPNDQTPANGNDAGSLYAVGSTGAIYTVNPATGAATLRATLNPALTATDGQGTGFNPMADRLRIHTTTGQNLRIDVETGATIVDGPLAYAPGDANAGRAPNLAATAYTNSVTPAPASTELFAIDVAQDALVKLSAPNNGQITTVGRLVVDNGAQIGFDIPGRATDRTGYATFTPPRFTRSFLYRVNLDDASRTPVGPVDHTRPIISLAVDDRDGATSVVLQNRSTTPALARSLVDGVDVFSLISSDDVLPNSPAFVFGGSADGAGLLKNADGTFTALVNHEDNFSVSRVTFDATFRPVAGEYVVNSTAGKYRMCSATLATPAEHGFGPVFLTSGESNEESQILAVDPAGALNTPKYLTGFGRWNAENTVPLPKTAYPGKTVVVIGDDDSGAEGGQLALYVSNTVGDLDNGSLHVLARTDDITRERSLEVGQTVPVEFRQIVDHQTLTGRQINQATVGVRAIAFGRVEDIDYRKDGTGREVYFAVTGQNNTGVNADYSRTKYGRVYRLTFDPADPLKGTLEVILDGDDRTGPARQFQNPDNIFVAQNYVYVQEDDNGYGDETHDGYIYQYNIASRQLRPVIELDHRRTQPDAALYNAVGARPAGKAGWEYGAMLDVSTELGIDDTFIIALQPHSWQGAKYRNPDGGSIRIAEQQASQLVIVKGLPR